MEYQLNGAMIQEDLSEAQAIFGVKIIPPERILPNKRYAFFSHTIKAQAENMKVLDTLVEKVNFTCITVDWISCTFENYLFRCHACRKFCVNFKRKFASE